MNRTLIGVVRVEIGPGPVDPGWKLRDVLSPGKPAPEPESVGQKGYHYPAARYSVDFLSSQSLGPTPPLLCLQRLNRKEQTPGCVAGMRRVNRTPPRIRSWRQPQRRALSAHRHDSPSPQPRELLEQDGPGSTDEAELAADTRRSQKRCSSLSGSCES